MKQKKYKPHVVKIVLPRDEYVPIEGVEKILRGNLIVTLFIAFGTLFLGVFFKDLNNQSIPFLFCGITFISCGIFLYITIIKKQVTEWKSNMVDVPLKK